MGKSCVKSQASTAAVIAVLMAVAMLGGCTGGSSGPANNVAATVNGVNISIDEVNEFYAYQAPAQQAALTKADALSLVIEREILYQEASRRGLAATTEEVEREYQMFLAQSNITETALEADLASKGSSVETFKSALGKRIAISKLQDSRIASQFIIKQDEAKAFYNASDFPALNISFANAEKSIVNFLTAQKRAAQWDSYVSGLKDKAKVLIIAVPI